MALLRLGGAFRKTLDTTRVIAVGGSNGKTTTVRLIDHILTSAFRGTASPKSFNNAVGVPLTLLGARRGDQYLVCEVGTNAPGEIAPLAAAVEPDIAVITSIGREHLEGLGTLTGVLQEEASLLGGLRRGGLAVLNADAPGLLEAARPLLAAQEANVITFGHADDADLRITATAATPEGLTFQLNGRDEYRLPLLGRHNAANAAAAVGVARRFGMDHAAIAGALAGAPGPSMRLERSAVAGVTFINDAYNANPESVHAALAAFADAFGAGGCERRVVILGDMLELGDHGPALHREIGAALGACGWLDLLVLVGPLGAHVADAARAGLRERLVHIPGAESDGPRFAAALLRRGDAVLLKGSRRVALERVIDAWRERSTLPADSIR